MLGRTQSASTIRWHTVMVPTAFMATARHAMTNGAASARSNDQLTC